MEIGAASYRGYTIRLVGEADYCSLTILPLTSELPTLSNFQFVLETPRGVDAIAEAKSQIDLLLTN
jgi:hypothetical protein